MPDPNCPLEVVIRELYSIIKFDYETTDMVAVRAALKKYAKDDLRFRVRQLEQKVLGTTTE